MPRRIEFPGYKLRMEEVRRELKASGRTQQQLADKAGLPGWQISHLLNGGLPEDIEDFRRFAEALEKPLGWFFLDEHEIAALLEFHGHGPSRGKKAPRRQGRRPLASLLLALGLGGASVLGSSPSGAAAMEAPRAAYITPGQRLSMRFNCESVVLLIRRRIALWLSSCTLTPVAA